MNTRKRASRSLPNNDSSAKKVKSKKVDMPPDKPTCDIRSDTSGASEMVDSLENCLRKEGKPSDAAPMKKYMREQFEFFGVKSARRREICKQVLHDKIKGMENSEVRELATILWRKPEREFQYCAVDILDKLKKGLCQNALEFDENIEFLKTLVVTKSWWDTVDCLSSRMVGYLVKTHPGKGTPVMKTWIKSDNMWLRRSAIIHQLSAKADTNSDLLFQFCLARCHEEEFFIRKAIGWALRAYAHTNPNLVKTFLRKNKSKLSKLSYNEASKHLSLPKK